MAQFQVLGEENRALKDRCAAMADGLRPVMQALVPGEQQLVDPLNAPEVMVDQCRNAWGAFKAFVNDATSFVAASVLGIVCSHYPRLNLERIEGALRLTWIGEEPSS